MATQTQTLAAPATCCVEPTVVGQPCGQEFEEEPALEVDCGQVEIVEKGGGISFFERYLSLWVLLCMIVGSLIGYYVPQSAEALDKVQYAQINGVVAVLLWIMIFPMLVQIDLASVLAVRKTPGAIMLTCAVNYLVNPFSMYGLAVLFFRCLYTSVIPDVLLCDNYIAGLILLAGAPCTAMVFVWSTLMGGDPAYTLVQVVLNDLLMLVFYVPTAALLIGVSGIALPWGTIILSVILFMVAPMIISAGIRVLIVRSYGEKFLNDRVVKPFKPVTISALLAMLVLIFIFQGKKIGSKPLHILLLAIPIILQVVFNFCITYAWGYFTCMPHSRLAPASLIATSNFFELAVAVAISAYGLDSGAALATVVGVLVEVPLMLVLVKFCAFMKPRLDTKCMSCDETCAGARDMGQKLIADMTSGARGDSVRRRNVAAEPSGDAGLEHSGASGVSVGWFARVQVH
eukprot:CAMPEP_0204126800 /NCGR_PEP_ID=MMETSP0361-20130328/11218_1 /ASSEMBLY_ACC=CAM_ASM_000343 /TAXON_ID=268821 /ORGANISM="Scrippsiella Hangoei, Strain SHTV-5" /LENGTH=457 /DNA_ID=CAMNT_0051078743 /DNA_START=77 /DNA_END=1448 /DNA_ORIENTATION=+